MTSIIIIDQSMIVYIALPHNSVHPDGLMIFTRTETLCLAAQINTNAYYAL